MTDQHPITPPPELVHQWHKATDKLQEIATKAARWGADTELEACCVVLEDWGSGLPDDLHNARRPQPPSLKKQALGALYAIATGADDAREFHQDIEAIKTALESLPD